MIFVYFVASAAMFTMNLGVIVLNFMFFYFKVGLKRAKTLIYDFIIYNKKKKINKK